MATNQTSLDPRINRINLADTPPATPHSTQWNSYEVFVQAKQGGKFQHEGAVNAPNTQLALVFAKEQYGRRNNIFNIWVAPTNAISQLVHHQEQANMFTNNKAKTYRNPQGFKVSDKITAYKKQHNKK